MPGSRDETEPLPTEPADDDKMQTTITRQRESLHPACKCLSSAQEMPGTGKRRALCPRDGNGGAADVGEEVTGRKGGWLKYARQGRPGKDISGGGFGRSKGGEVGKCTWSRQGVEENYRS